MSNSKLLARLRSLMEKVDSADKKQIKKLRKVLHKLKDRQKELEQQLEADASPDTRDRIRQEIDVIRLQRTKGSAVYRKIKAERKAREDRSTGES
jgi:Tfp pilus assembly pilus retraction ATPase PilT